MQGRMKLLYMILAGYIFIVSGCAPIIVGGAAVGGGTGTYFYINGELTTDYHFSFDKVWEACERVVANMHAIDVIPEKEISKGTIDSIIENEKVHFSVTYKAKDLTEVSVRVGLIGDRAASQRLHDKISDYLMKD